MMFTSDNGPNFGDSGDNCRDRFNCGFNGYKGLVYEGGIRVPLICRWPAGLDGGRQFHEMAHFCDWLPTLLAAAGLDVPAELDLDGVNILPVLRGEAGELPTERFWQWNRYQPLVTTNAAMRDGDWKLVRHAIHESFLIDPQDVELDAKLRQQPWVAFEPTTGPCPDRHVPPPPPPELYNLAEDPGEQGDLARLHPGRAARTLRDLETWFEKAERERATITDEW